MEERKEILILKVDIKGTLNGP